MKPATFEYVRAKSLDEACKYLATNQNALILAGGQSLIPMLSMRLARPSLLIDIAHIKGIDKLEKRDQTISIGAMVRQKDALSNLLVKKYLPLLIKGLMNVGHAPTRARGTIGGSIAQAAPSSEIALVAVTLGASIKVKDKNEDITFPANEFFLGPLLTLNSETGCIYEIDFPIPSTKKHGSGFRETSQRNSDYALASAAVQIESNVKNEISKINLAIGGVSDYPQLLNFENYWNGEKSINSIKAAILDAINEIEFVSDFHGSSEYRKRAVIQLAYFSFIDALQEIGLLSHES